MKLFDDEFEENTDGIDDTNITTTILYYSEEELAEFKRLAKIAIKKEFGAEYQQKGNLSDLLLKLLKPYDDKNN